MSVYTTQPVGTPVVTKYKSPPPKAVDPNKGLTGAKRDAAVALESLFKSYGLESLASQIVKMVQRGYSSDTIAIELQQTKEYKQRFAANDARLKAGLPVLSPAEYIATEQSYRQIMSAAGLPTGFYDKTSDFTKLIAGDVSPTEVQARVTAAQEAIQKAPPETLSYFKQFYNQGDLVAYALDPTVAEPLIEQRLKAAEAAALSAKNGLTLSQGNAEDIGKTGQSLDQISQNLQFVGQEYGTDQKLNAMYGGSLTQDDLVQEVFDNNSIAATKRAKLASQERGSFAGSSGQGKSSLSSNTGGSF